MNKEIQESLDELRLFSSRSHAIINDLETYIEAKDVESRDADEWYLKAQEHFKARASLQKVAGEQLAEILTLETKLVKARYQIEDQKKTIKVYQDLADRIVRRGEQLEAEIEVLKKNQKKPRKKRATKAERMATAIEWIESLK
jgi:hypothetical protein